MVRKSGEIKNQEKTKVKTKEKTKEKTKDRVMVFIDGSNLYHVMTQNLTRHDLRFGKFSEKLAGTRSLVRTYYYNIRQNIRSDEQERFLNSLYDTPYMEVRLGIVKQRGQAMVEKGVDVMIAIDLLKFAYEDLYDTAILVSGDGDFYPAIQAVKDLGKHVEIAGFDTNISPESSKISDLVIKFNKSYFNNLWMTKTEIKKIKESFSKKEIMDEDSSPEGENKVSRNTSKNANSKSSKKPPVRRPSIRSMNGNNISKSSNRNRIDPKPNREEFKNKRLVSSGYSNGKNSHVSSPPELRNGNYKSKEKEKAKIKIFSWLKKNSD